MKDSFLGLFLGLLVIAILGFGLSGCVQGTDASLVRVNNHVICTEGSVCTDNAKVDLNATLQGPGLF